MHEEWTDVLPKNMPTRARQLACLEGTPPFCRMWHSDFTYATVPGY